MGVGGEDREEAIYIYSNHGWGIFHFWSRWHRIWSIWEFRIKDVNFVYVNFVSEDVESSSWFARLLCYYYF